MKRRQRKIVKKQECTGQNHDHGAPNQRPILRFLNVGKALQYGSFPTQPQVKKNHLEWIRQVTSFRKNRSKSCASLFRKEKVPNMEKTDENKNESRHAVNIAPCLFSP